MKSVWYPVGLVIAAPWGPGRVAATWGNRALQWAESVAICFLCSFLGGWTDESNMTRSTVQTCLGLWGQ